MKKATLVILAAIMVLASACSFGNFSNIPSSNAEETTLSGTEATLPVTAESEDSNDITTFEEVGTGQADFTEEFIETVEGIWVWLDYADASGFSFRSFENGEFYTAVYPGGVSMPGKVTNAVKDGNTYYVTLYYEACVYMDDWYDEKTEELVFVIENGTMTVSNHSGIFTYMGADLDEAIENIKKLGEDTSSEDFLETVQGIWVDLESSSSNYFEFVEFKNDIQRAGWYPGEYMRDWTITEAVKNGDYYTITYYAPREYDDYDGIWLEEASYTSTLYLKDNTLISNETGIVLTRMGNDIESTVAAVEEYHKNK